MGTREDATILVVDPDSRLSAVAGALRDGGLGTVTTVDDIGAAIAACKEQSVDGIVVLDAAATEEYDHVDGATQVREIRTLVGDVPVVVYVEREGKEPIIEAYEAGADDVCRVPAGRSELLTRKVSYAAGVGGEFDDEQTRLRSIFDSYPLDLFVKDDMNRMIDLTAEDPLFRDFQREWVPNMTDFEFFGQDFGEFLYEEEQSMLEAEEPMVEKVEHYLTEAGEDRWVSTTKAPRYDDDGEVIGVVGSVFDVSHVKRQERAMAALNEAAQRLAQAETQTDIAQTAVEVAAEIGALPRVQIALYDDTRGSLDPVPTGAGESPPFETHDRWFHRAATGDAVYATPSDVDVPELGEEDVHVERSETVATPGLFVPLGEHGVVGFVTDGQPMDEFTVELGQVLASNVEAALDRAERERRLGETNDRLREFALLGSHELRNRIQTAYGQLARIDDEEAATLEQTIEGFDRLVTQLVTLARSGSLVQTTSPVDIRSVARRTWAELDHQGSTLEVVDSMRIAANEEALREIFGHLLRNAVEHAGPDVTITVGALTDGFFVADDGPGIPQAQSERAFQFDYDDAASRSGYGLYIVSTIAQSHGWTVQSTTGTDGGARIEITGVDVLDS